MDLTYTLTISGIIFLGFAAILISYIAIVAHKKKKLKPTQFITYGKHKFNRDFEFICEYCNSLISTKLSNCPVCSGAYGTNKEYKTKRRETNLAYLQFLKKQQQMIDDETQYIEDMRRLQKRNGSLFKANFFNYDLQPIPPFRKSINFEFSCEYCDTKLNGRSDDGGVCVNCSADYSGNVELLVAEQEESLERSHYTEYLILQDIQWNANIDNNEKAKRQTKHNEFWVSGIGRGLIALIAFTIVIGVPVVIYFILKYFTG